MSTNSAPAQSTASLNQRKEESETASESTLTLSPVFSLPQMAYSLPSPAAFAAAGANAATAAAFIAANDHEMAFRIALGLPEELHGVPTMTEAQRVAGETAATARAAAPLGAPASALRPTYAAYMLMNAMPWALPSRAELLRRGRAFAAYAAYAAAMAMAVAAAGAGGVLGLVGGALVAAMANAATAANVAAAAAAPDTLNDFCDGWAVLGVHNPGEKSRRGPPPSPPPPSPPTPTIATSLTPIRHASFLSPLPLQATISSSQS